MNDQTIEQEIQAKGKTAPRVTPQDIEDAIASEHYFTAADGVDGVDIRACRQRKPDQPLNLAPLNEDPVLGKTTEIGPLSLLSFCVLVLKNGFTVTGESACVSPENFDAEIGRKVARQNAVQKIWALLGFSLKQKLYEKA